MPRLITVSRPASSSRAFSSGTRNMPARAATAALASNPGSVLPVNTMSNVRMALLDATPKSRRTDVTAFPAFLCEIAAAARIPTLTPIAVRSSLALKGVLENFRSKFERELGTRLDLRFDATQSILAALRGGEEADFLILTAEAISVLQESGQVDTAQALGSSGVGLAVRAGAPKPDIGSVDALKHALLSARSVAHSK